MKKPRFLKAMVQIDWDYWGDGVIENHGSCGYYASVGFDQFNRMYYATSVFISRQFEYLDKDTIERANSTTYKNKKNGRSSRVQRRCIVKEKARLKFRRKGYTGVKKIPRRKGHPSKR